MELTTREADTLAFIAQFIDREGYSPTVRELQTALGLRSTSSSYRILVQLRDKGLISWNPNTSRTLRIPSPLETPLAS